MAENALLRQQLVVVARRVKRPIFRRHERAAVALLTAALPRWKDALLLGQPETVLRWHREGFRLLWRRTSRPTKTPTTRISPDVIDLVRRMATENRLWGAERIRGELLKLGIRVAKRSVQRHLHEGHRPRPRGQSWRAFLRNHTVWACDFLQTYDVWFRPVFAYFIVDTNTKQVVRVGVTRLGERHLEQVLEEYCVRYFNAARPHQGLDQHVPTPQIRKGFTKGSAIRSASVLGGLHHDYRIAA